MLDRGRARGCCERSLVTGFQLSSPDAICDQDGKKKGNQAPRKVLKFPEHEPYANYIRARWRSLEHRLSSWVSPCAAFDWLKSFTSQTRKGLARAVNLASASDSWDKLLPSLANILLSTHAKRRTGRSFLWLTSLELRPSHLLQSAQQGYRLGMGGRCTRHIKVIINQHSEWYHPSLIWR